MLRLNLYKAMDQEEIAAFERAGEFTMLLAGHDLQITKEELKSSPKIFPDGRWLLKMGLLWRLMFAWMMI